MQLLMKNVLKLLVGLLILCSLSGCENPHLKFTKVIVCISGDAGYICHNPRNNEDFIVSYEDGKNYICTTPGEYEKLQKGVINLANKYEQCLLDQDDWKNDQYFQKRASYLDDMSFYDNSPIDYKQK